MPSRGEEGGRGPSQHRPPPTATREPGRAHLGLQRGFVMQHHAGKVCEGQGGVDVALHQRPAVVVLDEAVPLLLGEGVVRVRADQERCMGCTARGFTQRCLQPTRRPTQERRAPSPSPC